MILYINIILLDITEEIRHKHAVPQTEEILIPHHGSLDFYHYSIVIPNMELFIISLVTTIIL